MDDDNDSPFGGSSDFSLSTPSRGPSFGNTTVNVGDYELGGGLLGKVDPTDRYNFGGTGGSTAELSLGDMFKDMSVPELSEEARMSLSNMFDFSNKFGLGLQQSGPMARFSTGPVPANNSIYNLNSAIMAPTLPNQTQEEPGWLDKGGFLYNYGIRKPGTEEARNFFDTETSQERDIRMGKVSDVVNSLATGLVPGMGMVNMARAAHGGYQALQRGAPVQDVAGKFLSGFGGKVGAAGSLMTGNYGRAATQLIPGINGRVAGMGIDAAQGKNVATPALTLGGQFLGNKIAGPVGGFLGGKLGSGLASLYRKNK
jgi:hypothetical protein